MATPTNLPATATAGQILTAQYVNDLRGAFRVLQVIFGTTSTQVTSANTTPVDTLLTATITPQSTSNQVLVFVQQNGLLKITNDTSITLNLLRGASVIGSLGTQLAVTASAATNGIGGAGYLNLDSPNTVSAVTYKTQFFSTNNLPTVAVQHAGAASSIVLMEISA
jgi:hypothetical protein